MKKILATCLIFFIAIQASKADTIDFWHIYFNGKKIHEFNQFSKDITIKLKLSEVKSGDSIRVNYFRDTPCSDCPHFLAITMDGVPQTTIATDKGTFNPLSFPVKTLLGFISKTNKKSFWIVYAEGQSHIPLFEIEFE